MLATLPIDRIVPDPENARKTFDEAKLRELAASIRERGLQQPIKVRPIPDSDMWQIIMGERRFRATQMLGATEILAHVEKQSRQEARLNGLIENIQRAELSPMEEACAFQAELDRGMTPESLARALGFSQPWRVTYRTRLLNLDARYQTLLTQGSLTLNAAQEIAKLGKADQTTIIKLINKGRLRSDCEVTTAVETLLNKDRQADLLGGGVTQKDADTLSRMEKQIIRLERLVASGWKNNECVIAARVSRDRATTMAEKLNLIRKGVEAMEKQLRTGATQIEILVQNR